MWVSLAKGPADIIEALVVATLIILQLAAVAQSMRAAVLYLLYLPLSLPSVCFYLCFMTSYGTARLSELSWGTKNTGSEACKVRAVLCGVALLFVAVVLTNDRGGDLHAGDRLRAPAGPYCWLSCYDKYEGRQRHISNTQASRGFLFCSVRGAKPPRAHGTTLEVLRMIRHDCHRSQPGGQTPPVHAPMTTSPSSYASWRLLSMHAIVPPHQGQRQC